jgi:hypothetical protein
MFGSDDVAARDDAAAVRDDAAWYAVSTVRSAQVRVRRG